MQRHDVLLLKLTQLILTTKSETIDFNHEMIWTKMQLN